MQSVGAGGGGLRSIGSMCLPDRRRDPLWLDRTGCAESTAQGGSSERLPAPRGRWPGGWVSPGSATPLAGSGGIAPAPSGGLNKAPYRRSSFERTVRCAGYVLMWLVGVTIRQLDLQETPITFAAADITTARHLTARGSSAHWVSWVQGLARSSARSPATRAPSKRRWQGAQRATWGSRRRVAGSGMGAGCRRSPPKPTLRF